jgi:hypothetical protein
MDGRGGKATQKKEQARPDYKKCFGSDGSGLLLCDDGVCVCLCACA